MTSAVNTKLGRHTVRDSRLACVDPEVKGQCHVVVKSFKCATSIDTQVDMTA